MPMSGVGRYVHELCAHIERRLPDARLFAYGRYPREELKFPSDRWLYRREENETLARIPSFLWLRSFGAARARNDRLDVFWGGRTLHTGRRVAPLMISTVHDLNHVEVPETMQGSTRLSHRLWFARDVRGADCVLVNSQGTRERLARHLKVEAQGIVRLGVRLPPQWQGVSAAGEGLAELGLLGVRPPYLLTVSTLEPRKNVMALVDAFVALKRSRQLPPDLRLVVAGAKGWIKSEAYRKIAALESEGVILPGYVPDELMGPLYANAQLFVFPSRYEGFGVPVLEARAWGTPTLVTRVPELIEAGESESIVTGFDAESIGAGILRALGQPRKLQDAAFYARHSWENSGDHFLHLIDSALRGREMERPRGQMSGALR